MTNREIINRAVQMYFNGEDWKGFIRKVIKDRTYYKKEFERVFRKWKA